jgi:hypothetical protein
MIAGLGWICAIAMAAIALALLIGWMLGLLSLDK